MIAKTNLSTSGFKEQIPFESFLGIIGITLSAR